MLGLDDVDPIELLTPVQQEDLRTELRKMAEQRRTALNVDITLSGGTFSV